MYGSVGDSLLVVQTAEETARFPDQAQPIPAPDLEGLDNAQRLAVCEEYARSMPGAVRLDLEPGDCCFYRNTLWHCGVSPLAILCLCAPVTPGAVLTDCVWLQAYDPAKPRATLHDIVDTAAYCAYRSAMDELGSGPRAVPDSAKEAYERRVWPWGWQLSAGRAVVISSDSISDGQINACFARSVRGETPADGTLTGLHGKMAVLLQGRLVCLGHRCVHRFELFFRVVGRHVLNECILDLTFAKTGLQTRVLGAGTPENNMAFTAHVAN